MIQRREGKLKLCISLNSEKTIKFVFLVCSANFTILLLEKVHAIPLQLQFQSWHSLP